MAGELKLFKQIAEIRPHVSGITGENISHWINSYASLNCFAHIIPKNGCNQLTFPNKEVKDNLLRNNPDNIMLVSPEEHFLIDHGTQEKRERYERQHNCSFDVFFEKKKKLIEEIKFKLKMGYH